MTSSSFGRDVVSSITVDATTREGVALSIIADCSALLPEDI